MLSVEVSGVISCGVFSSSFGSSWTCDGVETRTLPAASCAKGFWIGCESDDDDDDEEEEASRLGRGKGADVIVVDDSAGVSSCASILGAAFPSFASRLLRIYVC